MKSHPAADIFPALIGEQFDELAESIRRNGLRHPITRYEGMILDGRTRYRACKRVSVEPVFEDYEGDDPVQFVLDQNFRRRHLTNGQCAMVVQRIANMELGDNQHTKEGRPNGAPSKTSTEAAAKRMNVSVRSATRARRVVRDGTDEEVEAVERGDMSLGKAEARVRKREPRDRRRAGAKMRIPDDKTPEEVCREAMTSLDHGGSYEQAARSLGVDRRTLSQMRYIIELSDMADLADDDRETARRALALMNEARQSGGAYDLVRSLVERVWGGSKERKGQVADLPERRVRKFMDSVLLVSTSCEVLTQIPVPYPSAEQTKQLVGDLRQAGKNLRSVIKKLEGEDR